MNGWKVFYYLTLAVILVNVILLFVLPTGVIAHLDNIFSFFNIFFYLILMLLIISFIMILILMIRKDFSLNFFVLIIFIISINYLFFILGSDGPLDNLFSEGSIGYYLIIPITILALISPLILLIFDLVLLVQIINKEKDSISD